MKVSYIDPVFADGALISLLSFAVVMYVTPGPNNVMVAASAANHGIRATLPHMFGIVAGFPASTLIPVLRKLIEPTFSLLRRIKHTSFQ